MPYGDPLLNQVAKDLYTQEAMRKKTENDSGISFRKPLGGIGGQFMDAIVPTPGPKEPIGKIIDSIMNSNQFTEDKLSRDRRLALERTGTVGVDMQERLRGARGINQSSAQKDAAISTETIAPKNIISKNGSESGLKFNLYDKIKTLNDKEFLRFRNENPTVPGLGHMYDGDPNDIKFDKKGNVVSGKFTRLIEDPSKKPVEPMNDAQLKTIGPILEGLGRIRLGIGAQEQAAANREALTDYRQERLEQKGESDFENKLKTNAIKRINPETGDTQNDYRPWLLTQAINNPKNIHSKYKDEADLLAKNFDEYYNVLQGANKTKLDRGAILKKYISEKL